MSSFPHPHIACNRRVAAHDIRSCGPCSGSTTFSAGPQSHVGRCLFPYHALNHSRQRFCWHGIRLHKLYAILKVSLIFGSHPRQLLSGKKQNCGFWLHGARGGPQSHTSSSSRRNLHDPVTGGSQNHTTWTGKSYTKPKLALFHPAVRCSCARYVMSFLFVCSFVFMKLLSDVYVMFVIAMKQTSSRTGQLSPSFNLYHIFSVHTTQNITRKQILSDFNFNNTANETFGFFQSACFSNFRRRHDHSFRPRRHSGPQSHTSCLGLPTTKHALRNLNPVMPNNSSILQTIQ